MRGSGTHGDFCHIASDPAADITELRPAGGAGMRVRERRVVRMAVAAGVAALVAGVAMGAATRVLMRLVGLAVGHPAEFSWPGTIAIAVLFALLAVPAAATAAAPRAVRTGGRWVTAAVAGLGCARNGISDAQAVVLAEGGRLWLLAALIVAFGAAVVAFGWLAQRVALGWAGRRVKE